MRIEHLPFGEPCLKCGEPIAKIELDRIVTRTLENTITLKQETVVSKHRQSERSEQALPAQAQEGSYHRN